MLSSTSQTMSLATTFLALLIASPIRALQGAEKPSLQGCYSSDQGLTYQNTSIFQSSGACQDVCFPLGKAVMAMTGGTDCYCGDEMPPISTQVDISNCNASCGGWTPDNCGSASGMTPVFYAVWNAGLKSVVVNAQPSSASGGASSTSSATAAVVTVSGGQTVVVTASSTPNSGGGSSGPSTAGIAAGVVVGIIAIAAIVGGLWFYMRAKRRREVEEEYKRQAAVSAFINGGKPASSAGSSPDSRLDPGMMTQRRMSDGSIADNQDYSRRILKVTNA